MLGKELGIPEKMPQGEPRHGSREALSFLYRLLWPPLVDCSGHMSLLLAGTTAAVRTLREAERLLGLSTVFAYGAVLPQDRKWCLI